MTSVLAAAWTGHDTRLILAMVVGSPSSSG